MYLTHEQEGKVMPCWSRHYYPWNAYHPFWMDDDMGEATCARFMEELQETNDRGYEYHDVVVWFDDHVMTADVQWIYPYDTGWPLNIDPPHPEWVEPRLKRKKYMLYPRTDLIKCERCGGWYSPWYYGEEDDSDNDYSRRRPPTTKKTRFLRDMICGHMERNFLEQVEMLEENYTLIRQLEKEIQNGYGHQDNG
jgi:hypothetical protein